VGRTKTIDECGCCGGDASCCVCTLWMISHLVPTWPLCHPEIVQMTDLSGVILQENTDYCDPDAQCPYSILGKQVLYMGRIIFISGGSTVRMSITAKIPLGTALGSNRTEIGRRIDRDNYQACCCGLFCPETIPRASAHCYDWNIEGGKVIHEDNKPALLHYSKTYFVPNDPVAYAENPAYNWSQGKFYGPINAPCTHMSHTPLTVDWLDVDKGYGMVAETCDSEEVTKTKDVLITEDGYYPITFSTSYDLRGLKDITSAFEFEIIGSSGASSGVGDCSGADYIYGSSKAWIKAP